MSTSPRSAAQTDSATGASSLVCPFCGSDDVELVSSWGGQLITAAVRCVDCNTHFESVRDTFAPAPR